MEPEETKEQALIRECQEELAVTISVGEVFMEVDHDYPDLNVHLTLFNAAIIEGTPRMLEHNDIQWIKVDEIPQYEFCPADKEILRRLQAKAWQGGRLHETKKLDDLSGAVYCRCRDGGTVYMDAADLLQNL